MRSPDEGQSDLSGMSAECSRIGFDVRELRGLAFSDRSAFAHFLDLLREIPSGVELAGFRQHMRKHGFDL